MKRVFVCFGVCMLSVSLAAVAQGVGTSGEIRGTAKDVTGAIVPNATVTVTNPQTGLRRSVTTDAAGGYQVTGLPPASYEVTAASSGTRPPERPPARSSTSSRVGSLACSISRARRYSCKDWPAAAARPRRTACVRSGTSLI